MSLVPSRQIYPTGFFDTFQSSLSKFHGTPLQIFRYGCSISVKKQNFNSISMFEQYPRERFELLCKRPVFGCNIKRGLCSGNWMDRWNEQSKQIRLKQPCASVNYRKNDGGGEGSTMEKIVKKLRKFGYVDEGGAKSEGDPEREIEKGSVEDILYVEEGMLPNSRGGFTEEGSVFRSDGEVRFPWEKRDRKEGEEKWSARPKSRFFLAELTLPESELRRLRNLTLQTKSKTKIGGSGVTQAVADKIHEKWKTSEIVKIKVEGAPALNMKRMHEILERKTGGLVIWRSGTSLSLYRGVSYEDPSVQPNKRMFKRKEMSTSSSPTATSDITSRDASTVGPYNDLRDTQMDSISTTAEMNDTEQLPEVNYEEEVDKLLDGLGSRYTDWPGCDPLPVDADLLPGLVRGYEPPFRVLPFGVRRNLGQKEATNLRRLARVLPPHFALGRSRQLQGLAVAMTKLWEKSLIAKIALKRGVQLTTSERMAEQIKKLTGGTLLSRNKDFLVFYRGKDFLSPEVTEALLERERLAKSMQDEEEQARQRASAFFLPNKETDHRSGMREQSASTGTLAETLDADSRWGKKLDDHHKEKVLREAKIIRHANLVKKLEQKLARAEKKIMKAEKALAKVEESLEPAARQAYPESITEEERFMFRKLGLRMKAFLLLGRRGVFDGTIENMHLHWKYRELVKIIVKIKTFEQVKKVALALEAESSGILVSVDKISKGFAIILYRGKDYKRPPRLRPKNLLTKRKALARSIELQRQEALLKHISQLENRVGQLKAELDQMQMVKDQGDDVLYDRLDSAYATEDEDSEDEAVDAYLETFNSINNSEDETEDIDNSHQSETNFPYSVEDVDSITDPKALDQHALKSSDASHFNY